MGKIALFVVLAGVSLLGSMRAQAATHVGGLGLGGSGGFIKPPPRRHLARRPRALPPGSRYRRQRRWRCWQWRRRQRMSSSQLWAHETAGAISPVSSQRARST